jgi:hypothetical protein
VRKVVDSKNPQWFAIANFGGIGIGANVAFRHCAFAEWPGFDERLGLGAEFLEGEEHNAFSSLISLGYRVVYTPYAVVRHPSPATLDALRARYVRMVKATAARITLLFLEQPQNRKAIFDYLLDGLRGKPRPWRKNGSPQVRIVSRLRAFSARVAGWFICLKWCVTHRSERWRDSSVATPLLPVRKSSPRPEDVA